MGQGKAVLHGPGRRKITKSTAVSLVAKHWAMYFLGVIFIDSLQYLYELGAALGPFYSWRMEDVEVADQERGRARSELGPK